MKSDKQYSPDVSFDEIYIKYSKQIELFCQTKTKDCVYSSEEISQDVFTALFVKWDSLRSHAEPVILSWLYRTAKNMIADQYRKRKKIPETISIDDESFQQTVIFEDMSPFDNCSQLTYEEYMVLIEGQLTSDELVLFRLVVEEKMPMHLIASIIEKKPNTVRTRWMRLKKKIAKILATYDNM